MRTTIRFFSILAAVGLAFAFGKAKPVQAADWCVNPTGTGGCYTSIQAAIDAASSGDTITVAQGTYVGNLTITKTLAIIGDTTVDILHDSSPDNFNINGVGDTDTIHITAGGVTVRGFNIRGYQTPAGSYVTIRLTGAAVDQASIRDNAITSSNIGIRIENASHDVVIRNNAVAGAYISIDMAASGNFIQLSRITSSTMAGFYGRENSDQNSLTGNEIKNNAGDGIYLNNASVYTITGNVINDNHNGIKLWGSHDNTITSNTFFSNDNDGILIWQTGASDLSSPNAINLNNFNNDVYNLEVEDGINTINAERNWWGTDYEPEFTEKITGTIDYQPWCINEFCTSMAIHNLNLDTFYSSIQAAVFEAEEGNSIAIEDGTYVENVYIDKPIEIGGSGAGDTIILTQDLGPVCTEPSTNRICDGAFSIFMVASDGVYIHDLTVDGDNPDWDSDYDIGGANIDTRNGIIARYTTGQYDMRVERVTAKNFYMTGIYSTGPGSVFTDVTVQNVQGDTTYALGIGGNVEEISDSSIAHTTIAIGLESDEEVLVDDNTISDARSGILSYNSGVGEQITNNVISACKPSGFGIVISSNRGAVNVANNQVAGCNMGLSVAGSAFTTTPVTFTNNSVTLTGSPTGSYGVYLTTNKHLIGGTGSVSANFTDNSISGFANGVYIYDPNHLTIQTDFYHNRLTGNTAQVTNGSSGTLTSSFEENWWGSTAGPATGSISADLDFTPWCGNSACTSLVPSAGVIEIPAGTTGSVVQQYLNNAPQNTEIRFLGSPGSLAGGFMINTPYLTILLRNGTVIQNNSPCFVINANYTTIRTESVGGASCVPMNGSNGIDVTAPRVNTVIQGIEFPGAAGADGIHFAGAITDVVLVNNWFHNFTGDGIDFSSQPAGTVNIQGNLFQSNGGLGINSPGSVPAQYNSWGHVDGVDGGEGAGAGDGASSGVVTNPYTHVDLYLVSSDTQQLNQVLPGQTIKYTVYAHLRNTLAMDFYLYYPAALTLTGDPVNEGYFDSMAYINTATPGRIHFYGMSTWDDEYGSGGGYPPVNGDVPIFSATFTAGAPTSGAALNLDELTDKFAMEPYQSSNNIYAAALADGTVTILTSSSVTGTISTQGRASQYDISAELTSNESLPWGPYETLSFDEEIDNLVFSEVAGGNYTFTTSQQRCLNVTTALAKHVQVSGNRSIAALQLKCGNAIWTDNIIDILDASVIGATYGTSGLDLPGDANFDGMVDILDLSMLGGNFNVTSDSAYAAWTP